jgi:hypothetical protein
MIYMWFTGINYYKLAIEKDRDSIFTTITTIWKPGITSNSKHEQSPRKKHCLHSRDTSVFATSIW